MTGAKLHPLATDRRGFTLLEILVATALFVVIVTILTDLFLVLERRRGAAAHELAVVQESQRVLADVAASVARGSLDFSPDWPSAATSDELHLVTPDGTATIYRFGDFPECNHCLGKQVNGGEWTPLNRPEVDLDTSQFGIAPTVNPFTIQPDGSYAVSEQPRVTIVLHARSAINSTIAPLTLQTTVVSRWYQR